MSVIEIPFSFESGVDKVIGSLRQEGWYLHGSGSDREPYTSEWCKSLDNGIDALWRGYNIIDWGCGYGRFLNYLLTRAVKKFKYYGFELHGAKNGDVLLNFCKRHYSPLNCADRLIKFGYVDDDELINEAMGNCNTVLLGSVFTHMGIEDSLKFLEKFHDFICKGGIIVFSLIIEKDKYELVGKGEYGIEDGYAVVFHSQKELQMLSNKGKYSISNIGSFQTDHHVKHDIFVLRNNV